MSLAQVTKWQQILLWLMHHTQTCRDATHDLLSVSLSLTVSLSPSLFLSLPLFLSSLLFLLLSICALLSLSLLSLICRSPSLLLFVPRISHSFSFSLSSFPFSLVPVLSLPPPPLPCHVFLIVAGNETFRRKQNLMRVQHLGKEALHNLLITVPSIGENTGSILS